MAAGVALLAWAANVPVLFAVLADADRGLDMMDESHYLMAAQPWAADKAFNGMFGWYSGPMLRLVGDDVGRFRVLAALLLIAAALVLARAVRLCCEAVGGQPWSPGLRQLAPPAVVAAALCYYTVFVRTPSYNWFAAVGLMLAAAGLLRLLVLDGPGRPAVLAGMLVSAGAFVTGIGKITTAAAATAVVLVVVAGHLVSAVRGRPATARAVRTAVLSGLAVGAVLIGLHVTLVHSLPFTVATYRRVAGMLEAVDPFHYAPGMLPDVARIGLRGILLDRPERFLPLLVLPLVAGVASAILAVRARGAGRRAGRWPAVAHAAAWWVTLLVVLWSYPGGVPGLGMSVSPLVIAAEAALLVAVLWWSTWCFGGGGGEGVPSASDGRAAGAGGAGGVGPRPGTAALACAALLAMGVAYPVGTNVEYATQLHGAFPVLLAAAVVGVSALPAGAGQGAVISLAVGALLLGAVLVPRTRAVAPFRLAPFAEQTVPREIVAGTPAMFVDPATAAWIDDLRRLGEDGGFTPGTPMLDLTWHPGSVLVLGGRAPSVLLPAFPGLPDPGGSAAYALRQEDPAVWRQAWVLIPVWQPAETTDRAVAVVGRRFPADYRLVGTVTAPFDGQVQALWQPR